MKKTPVKSLIFTDQRRQPHPYPSISNANKFDDSKIDITVSKFYALPAKIPSLLKNLTISQILSDAINVYKAVQKSFQLPQNEYYFSLDKLNWIAPQAFHNAVNKENVTVLHLPKINLIKLKIDIDNVNNILSIIVLETLTKKKKLHETEELLMNAIEAMRQQLELQNKSAQIQQDLRTIKEKIAGFPMRQRKALENIDEQLEEAIGNYTSAITAYMPITYRYVVNHLNSGYTTNEIDIEYKMVNIEQAKQNLMKRKDIEVTVSASIREFYDNEVVNIRQSIQTISDRFDKESEELDLNILWAKSDLNNAKVLLKENQEKIKHYRKVIADFHEEQALKIEAAAAEAAANSPAAIAALNTPVVVTGNAPPK